MGNDLFVLSTIWPSKGLSIPGLILPQTAVIQLLGFNKKVTFTNNSMGVVIQAPWLRLQISIEIC